MSHDDLQYDYVYDRGPERLEQWLAHIESEVARRLPLLRELRQQTDVGADGVDREIGRMELADDLVWNVRRAMEAGDCNRAAWCAASLAQWYTAYTIALKSTDTFIKWRRVVTGGNPRLYDEQKRNVRAVLWRAKVDGCDQKTAFERAKADKEVKVSSYSGWKKQKSDLKQRGRLEALKADIEQTKVE